jgi:hypothetical protein
MCYSFVFSVLFALKIKIRTKPKQKEFFVWISEWNGKLAFVPKNGNETKAKGIDVINIGAKGMFTFIPVKNWNKTKA